MIRSARSARKTLTEAVQEEIRQAILSGTYSPGSQLPTEAELGQMLGASRTVVREALRILEEDGLISRRHGIGTFVRKHAILNNLNVNYGITEMIQLAGLEPGTKHLAVFNETADDEIAAQSNVPPGTPTVTIERVRTADGKPVVYALDTFAETLLHGAPFDPARLLSESVYKILQDEFGHSIEMALRVSSLRKRLRPSWNISTSPQAPWFYISFKPITRPSTKPFSIHANTICPTPLTLWSGAVVPTNSAVSSRTKHSDPSCQA